MKATDICKKTVYPKLWASLDAYRGEGECAESRTILHNMFLKDASVANIDALIECISEHPEIREDVKSTLIRIVDIITE